MSKHTRRLTPASRNNRRATIAANRNAGTFQHDIDDHATYTTDCEFVQQFGVGAIAALNDTPRKTRKHPLGFTGGT